MLWTAYAAAEILGNRRWVLYGGGILILAGAGVLSWSRRCRTQEIEARRTGLGRMETALQERAERIGRRQRELARQLMQLHEWTEFPGGDLIRPASDDHLPVAEDLGEKDRAVAALLEKRTEILFEKIKNNAYQTGGVFQKERLVEDLIGLVEDVARIYNPGSKRPLLETSVERLLRAANRISLQLLLLLEGLPLDIKSYNLQTTYETIRKGIRAYGVYKSAEPYLSYARPFYYMGRYALGAAPVVLGAGWAVSQMVKSGARRFSTSMANRYALGLLGDMVRIIGGEAAGVFGGDYRHRDPNWIYGAELTDLVAACALSPDIHRFAIEEISGLALRNEYDRIFLYRCLASGTSAGPNRFADPASLPMDQRETVAKRLERFHKRCLRGISDESGGLAKWRRDAEGRLGVKIRLAEKDLPAPPSEEKTATGVFSLAGFLLEVKGRDPEETPAMLSGTRMFESLGAVERDTLLKALLAAPPMVFEYPEMETGDRHVADFLSDLISLTVKIHPRNEEMDAVVADAARHFRKKDLVAVKKRLDREYVDFLSASLREDSPEKRISPQVARSLLYMLMEDESPRFLYRSIHLRTEEGSGKSVPFPPYAEPWLMGTDRRLVLAAVNRRFQSPPILVWSVQKSRDGSETATVSRLEGRFRDACRLMGGGWHWDRLEATASHPAILISGAAMGRYKRFFRPLIEFFGATD